LCGKRFTYHGPKGSLRSNFGTVRNLLFPTLNT